MRVVHLLLSLIISDSMFLCAFSAYLPGGIQICRRSCQSDSKSSIEDTSQQSDRALRNSGQIYPSLFVRKWGSSFILIFLSKRWNIHKRCTTSSALLKDLIAAQIGLSSSLNMFVGIVDIYALCQALKIRIFFRQIHSTRAKIVLSGILLRCPLI